MNDDLSQRLHTSDETLVLLHCAVCNLPQSHARGLFEAFLVRKLEPRIVLIRTGFAPLARREHETPPPLNLPPLGDEEGMRADIATAVALRQTKIGTLPRPPMPHSVADGLYSYATQPGLVDGILPRRDGKFVTYLHPESEPEMHLPPPVHLVFTVWDEVEVMRTVVVAYDAWEAEMYQRLAYDALTGEEGGE